MPELLEIQPQLNKARAKVEINSRTIDLLCKEMIDKYAVDLDKLIDTVKDMLNSNEEITTEEFEMMALKLPTLLYSVSCGMEYVGIRMDVSKAFEKEKYASTYLSLSTGSVKEKEFIATNDTYSEFIISVVTSRTYKQLQQKVQAGYELLAAVKKVLTRRIQTYALPEN